jgi:polysaccharide export outer membrane protein
MKTALALVSLAFFPLTGFAANDAGQPAQEQQAPSVAPSPKATIPMPPPGNGAPKPAAPAVSDAPDPSKMAAAEGSPGSKIPGAATVNDKSYEIGAEDVLNVLVWGNPPLSGQVMVRSDGKITVGLIGEVQASGQTALQLAAEIRDKLKDGGFLRSPQVTVSVVQINSKKFYIQGEVNKPGAYSLVVPMNALEALVNAGGFRDFANKKDIRILRGSQQYHFNYNKVIKGQNRDQNIMLQPGDLIIVK